MVKPRLIKTRLDRAHVNLNARRRRNKLTLFRMAHRMHVRNGMEVFVVIHHHNEDRYRVYTSQPGVDWPPPLQKLERSYPVPEIWTPANIAPLYLASPSASLPTPIEISPLDSSRRAAYDTATMQASHAVAHTMGATTTYNTVLGQGNNVLEPDRDGNASSHSEEDEDNNEDNGGGVMGFGNNIQSGKPAGSGRAFGNYDWGEPMTSLEKPTATSGLHPIMVDSPQRPAQLGSPIVFRDEMPAMSPCTPSPPPGLASEAPSSLHYLGDNRHLDLRFENLGLATPRKSKTARTIYPTPHRSKTTPRKVKMPPQTPVAPMPRKTAPGEITRRTGASGAASSSIAGGIEKTWLTQCRQGGKFVPGRR